MIDYKTFKKEHLTEWVDRSQAARRAAEELANKEVRPSLRDKYTYEVQNPDIVFALDGHKVEFKGENEKKPDGDIYFTYDEAIERFSVPDLKDGWRLPTEEEFEVLCKYPYKFDENNKQGVFGNRLYLPATGSRDCHGKVNYAGFYGFYWSFMPKGSDYVWYLDFNWSGVHVFNSFYRRNAYTVRLVRDMK